VALVVAKIARSDYPREWPGLVSDLLGRAHSGNTLTVRAEGRRGEGGGLVQPSSNEGAVPQKEGTAAQCFGQSVPAQLRGFVVR
jgi:hypothetical protein